MASENGLPDHLPGRPSLPIEVSGIKEEAQATGAGHAAPPPARHTACAVQEGKL